jgi:hypothetical protein
MSHFFTNRQVKMYILSQTTDIFIYVKHCGTKNIKALTHVKLHIGLFCGENT